MNIFLIVYTGAIYKIVAPISLAWSDEFSSLQ